jgi:hypothetical protein
MVFSNQEVGQVFQLNESCESRRLFLFFGGGRKLIDLVFSNQQLEKSWSGSRRFRIEGWIELYFLGRFHGDTLQLRKIEVIGNKLDFSYVATGSILLPAGSYFIIPHSQKNNPGQIGRRSR